MSQEKKAELARRRAEFQAINNERGAAAVQRWVLCSTHWDARHLSGAHQSSANARHISLLNLCRRAEEAEKAYCELAGMLSQAPDPLPFLNSLLPLQKSLLELQKENKRLHLYSKAAESEASSASEVVLRNRDLEKRVADLEAQLEEKVCIRTNVF